MNHLETYLVGIAETPVHKTAFILLTTNLTISPETMVKFVIQQHPNSEKIILDTKHFGKINPDDFELPEDVYGVFITLLFNEMGYLHGYIPIFIEREMNTIKEKFKSKLEEKYDPEQKLMESLFHVSPSDKDDETGASLEEVILIDFLYHNKKLLAKKPLREFIRVYLDEHSKQQ